MQNIFPRMIVMVSILFLMVLLMPSFTYAKSDEERIMELQQKMQKLDEQDSQNMEKSRVQEEKSMPAGKNLDEIAPRRLGVLLGIRDHRTDSNLAERGHLQPPETLVQIAIWIAQALHRQVVHVLGTKHSRKARWVCILGACRFGVLEPGDSLQVVFHAAQFQLRVAYVKAQFVPKIRPDLGQHGLHGGPGIPEHPIIIHKAHEIGRVSADDLVNQA